MNTSYIKLFLLIFFGSQFSNVFSQNNFESLGESSFALNYKSSTRYKVNFAMRYRYFLFKNNDFNFEDRQIDLVHFSTYSINYNKSISLGIQYRNRNFIDGGSNELRFTEQYNYTKQNSAIRFGHRFRIEQRILDNLTILRSRYRFALDFPLNGEKLDINEKYLILALEVLLSVSDKTKPATSNRVSSILGWVISEKSKIQLGLEYRLADINIQPIHLLFINTSFIYKL